jgi:primosomal replication protein N
MRLQIMHRSEQVEAGGARKVEMELQCVAVEQEARLLAAAPVGANVKLTGFLAPKGKSNRLLVLHIRQIEFLS